MLKIYDKLEDAPEGLREHYKQSGSKYVPELSDDHPVLQQNKTLIQEKGVVEAKVKNLQSDLDTALQAAKDHGVPRGQALVSKADAELIEKYKPLGTPDELTALKTEHKSLKDAEAKHQREANLKLVAKELGYDNVDAFIRLPLPDMEIREKDGKKTVIAKVKDGETVTEKPAAEFIESSPDIAPFLAALKSTDGVRMHGGSTDSGAQADPFKWAKDFAKSYTEQSAPIADPYKAFNERQSA